jgi:hypothetical protein
MWVACSIKFNSPYIANQNAITVHSNSRIGTQMPIKQLTKFEMPMYVPSNYIKLPVNAL